MLMASSRLPAAAALLTLLLPFAPAADFTINMVDAKPLTLSQYKGHPVVLAFILTSCPHCQNAVKVLSKLQTEYGPRGLQVLASAIEQDSQQHVRLFVKNFAPPFPVGYNTGAEKPTPSFIPPASCP
jgi:cytochrome oxidase Cu insertion factor (SCO1/SenC/PrrC family)